MSRGSIAAFAAGAACLLAAAGTAAGSADSRITRQDSKAEFNARNMTSAVEACWADRQDYRQCRSAAMPYVRGFTCMTHASHGDTPEAGKKAPDSNQMGRSIKFMMA